tara:strand:- start:531 stop:956 length:426 start_codon:yes stop_codon:yes gene_type:complete
MMIYPIEEIAGSLKRHEGYAQHAYVCPAGATSVGYGRNLDQKHGGLGISEEEAEYLLANDIKRSIEECESFGWWADCPMDKRQVIIELAFQLGWPALTGFNLMLTHMASGLYDQAAAELLDSRFARQVPHRAAELAERLRA